MSKYTKRSHDKYVYTRTIEMAEKYKDKSFKETEKIYHDLLSDMDYANKDFAGYYWETKILCYVLNYKRLNYDKEELKNLIYAFEDDPVR